MRPMLALSDSEGSRPSADAEPMLSDRPRDPALVGDKKLLSLPVRLSAGAEGRRRCPAPADGVPPVSDELVDTAPVRFELGAAEAEAAAAAAATASLLVEADGDGRRACDEIEPRRLPAPPAPAPTSVCRAGLTGVNRST